MAYKTLTEKEINKLHLSIVRGDKNALSTVKNLYRKLAKTANQRLLRLEKAGFETTSNAYEWAAYYLQDYKKGNKLRFSENPTNMDIDEILETYRVARHFVAKETSTVRGVKYARKRLIDAVEEMGYEIPENDLQKFYEFVNSDAVQDAMVSIGNSNIVVDAITNGFYNLGKSIDDMMKNFERYNSGELLYDELLERVGGMSIAELYKRQRNRGTNRNIKRRRNRR